MPEHKIKLRGWKALAAGAVLLGVFAFRLMTFGDKTGDAALMRQVHVQLASDYYPHQVDRLRAARQGGDAAKLDEVVQSIATGELKIESVRTSAPLFDLSSPKDVVVKVTYVLEDDSGETTEPRTKYYLFKYGSVGNLWHYKYETGAVKYYLNLL